MNFDSTRKRIEHILKGYDLLAAVVVLGLLSVLLPFRVDNAFAKDVFGMGVSVLSIIFSVFFAALAIIIASSDNDFVGFLEEQKIYSGLVFTFRFTLWLLFVSLFCAVTFYVLSAYWISHKYVMQSKWWFVSFSTLGCYGLCAAFGATQDALIYAKYRSLYVAGNRDKPRQIIPETQASGSINAVSPRSDEPERRL